VTLSVYQGRRRLALHTVPVGLTTCTYRSTFRFAHISGSGARKLTVKARYLGDMWDAPSTRSMSVWAG